MRVSGAKRRKQSGQKCAVEFHPAGFAGAKLGAGRRGARARSGRPRRVRVALSLRARKRGRPRLRSRPAPLLPVWVRLSVWSGAGIAAQGLDPVRSRFPGWGGVGVGVGGGGGGAAGGGERVEEWSGCFLGVAGPLGTDEVGWSLPARVAARRSFHRAEMSTAAIATRSQRPERFGQEVRARTSGAAREGKVRAEGEEAAVTGSATLRSPASPGPDPCRGGEGGGQGKRGKSVRCPIGRGGGTGTGTGGGVWGEREGGAQKRRRVGRDHEKAPVPEVVAGKGGHFERVASASPRARKGSGRTSDGAPRTRRGRGRVGTSRQASRSRAFSPGFGDQRPARRAGEERDECLRCGPVERTRASLRKLPSGRLAPPAGETSVGISGPHGSDGASGRGAHGGGFLPSKRRGPAKDSTRSGSRVWVWPARPLSTGPFGSSSPGRARRPRWAGRASTTARGRGGSRPRPRPPRDADAAVLREVTRGDRSARSVRPVYNPQTDRAGRADASRRLPAPPRPGTPRGFPAASQKPERGFRAPARSHDQRSGRPRSTPRPRRLTTPRLPSA